MIKPEIGGPYRRRLKFEEAVDRGKIQTKGTPIDRSGLVAVNSYELGYLRDSMDSLMQRELDIEAREAIKRHMRHVAHNRGISFPVLEGLTRQAHQAQHLSAPSLGPDGARDTPEQLVGVPSQLGAEATISNPVAGLTTFARARQEAEETAEARALMEEREQQAQVDEGLAVAHSALGHFGAGVGHTGNALYHAAAGAGHLSAGTLTGGLSALDLVGRMAQGLVGNPNLRTPGTSGLSRAERVRWAQHFTENVASAVADDDRPGLDYHEPPLASGATAEDREAARQNFLDVGRAQAERARLETAEVQRPTTAPTIMPYGGAGLGRGLIRQVVVS